MKKVAVLPYNEYEKMKYNNTASVQNSFQPIHHSQSQYSQLLPPAQQNPQSQTLYTQILHPNALTLQPLSHHQQQLPQQNPYIVNDSLSFQQPLPCLLYTSP